MSSSSSSPFAAIDITNCSHAEKGSETYTAYIIEYQRQQTATSDVQASAVQASDVEIAAGKAEFAEPSSVGSSTITSDASVKRFSEFYVFDAYLRARGFACLPPLPARTLLKLYNAEFVAARQAALQTYLRRCDNTGRHRVCFRFLLCFASFA
jgi:hypothetical protein